MEQMLKSIFTPETRRHRLWNFLFGGSRITVVVCDDSRTQLMLMQTWLEHEGFQVVATATSRDLAVLLCHRDRPDVLVMDYHMPGETIGIRKLRMLLPNLPIVIWTASNREDIPIEDVVTVQGVVVKMIDKETAGEIVRTAAKTVPMFLAPPKGETPQ